MILFESEKELEDVLCDHLEDGVWLVDDTHVDGHIRQAKLESYGVVDLLLHTIEADIVDDTPRIVGHNINAVELKITELKADSVHQIARYKAFFDKAEHDFNMSYTLVCKASPSYPGDLVYLVQNIEWLDVYTYELSLTNGIEFNCLGSFSPTSTADNNRQSTVKCLEMTFCEGK